MILLGLLGAAAIGYVGGNIWPLWMWYRKFRITDEEYEKRMSMFYPRHFKITTPPDTPPQP